MYNLPKLSHIKHRDYPTPYYQKILQIFKEYEIILQELTNEKIRKIYNRICYPDKRSDKRECALCLQFQDSAVHVFARCSITGQIWTILQEVFNNITETSFPLDNFKSLNFFVPIQFENFTESIALILTVTYHCIWQIRKRQLNSDCLKLETVKPSNVLAMIFNHIKTHEKK